MDIHETISQPVEEVFARLVDIDRYSAWRAGGGGIFLTCSQDSPGPVDVGMRYTDRTRLGTAHGTVVEFHRPRRVIFHYTFQLLGRTAIEGWPGYTLESDGAGGTRLHHHAEAKTYGPLRLLKPLIQWVADRERRATQEASGEPCEQDTDGDADENRSQPLHRPRTRDRCQHHQSAPRGQSRRWHCYRRSS